MQEYKDPSFMLPFQPKAAALENASQYACNFSDSLTFQNIAPGQLALTVATGNKGYIS